MKKLTAILIITVMVLTVLTPAITVKTYAETAMPAITAEAAILIDAKSGEVLYNKNMDALMEPASTTKIMTCILALENLDLAQVITIDAETPYTEGSRIFLEEGEQMTVEDLIYALMLESANDTAVALGKAISGNVQDFAKLMNEKARKIGAKNPSFVNPNGLHEEGHLASAYDLAMIAKYAMENEQFRKIVSTYKYQMSATNIRPERAEIFAHNTNRLLYDEKTKLEVNGVTRTAKYDGVTGIKTGYTSKAGGCLVAGAKRNGTELIAVALKSTDAQRFSDCIALLDYGFANYHTALAVDKGVDLGKADVKMGAVGKVAITTKEGAYVTLPIEASSSVVTTRAVLDQTIKAPVKKGQKVGVVEIYEGETLRSTIDITAKESVAKGTFLSAVGIGNKAAYTIFVITGILALGVTVVTVMRAIVRKKRAQRRRELRLQRAMEIAKQRQAQHEDYKTRGWDFSK